MLEWTHETLGIAPHYALFVLDLVLGGLLAQYIRFLYMRCGSAHSDAESLSSVFPLLTLIIIAVISVVKSSLALSLGLVGALSIVRFRAAIKNPEELVYLFLCIAVGLALGAGQRVLAVVLVVFASVFILARRYFGGGRHRHDLLVTVTGPAAAFESPEGGMRTALEVLAPDLSIQRYEVEQDRGACRVVVRGRSAEEALEMVGNLRLKLPDCSVSFLNMQSLL